MPGFTHERRMPKVPFFLPADNVCCRARYRSRCRRPTQAGLQELEQLVTELESGQLPLDQLLGSYQRGAALLAFCRDKLQAVEDQIKVLDAGSLKVWASE